MILIDKKNMSDYIQRFNSFKEVIAIEAALLGHSRGKLFVDCIETPGILILWNEFDGFYIEVSSVALLEGVRAALESIIVSFDQETSAYVIYISDAYDEYIDKVIPATSYERLDVLYYTMGNSVKVPTVSNDILAIEKDTFHNFNQLEEILDTIDSTWTDRTTFFDKGYGFICVDEKKDVKGYCISEHVTNDALEFSVEVREEERGRGIATTLGHAMLKVCLDKRLKPAWFCTEDNRPSMKVAEKIGLVKKADFHVWYFEKE